MRKLVQLFTKIVKQHEGLEMINYRSDRLKERMKQDFPQLCFHKPYRKNQCEMVFTEELSTGSVLDRIKSSEEEYSTTGESSSEIEIENTILAIHHDISLEKVRTVFNAGTIVHNEIKDSPAMSCNWPPISDDINLKEAIKMIPFHLYNLIAWCIGVTFEPNMATYVDVSPETMLKFYPFARTLFI
ncbi:uncharacterized protein [Antedon mediterranea]|uniref:uncharacterized protein n=1 Tax=Antedon mediterranea TaxID=105859 RepID=UPI003AF589E3